MRAFVKVFGVTLMLIGELLGASSLLCGIIAYYSEMPNALITFLVATGFGVIILAVGIGIWQQETIISESNMPYPLAA